ncbi:hypothetical protein PanWU01x14_147510 [Parasponia andersonii]|uniref:Uncharacterized protein n=1 Tax=Parasponia andersonii TaxID=3476 RepID=A0A2P5CJD8_PARAD|nr:hypothetical protein PanWU01x14_147510 [Parasponia andersonii]
MTKYGSNMSLQNVYRPKPMSLLLMSNPSPTICNRPSPHLCESGRTNTDLKKGAPLPGPVKVGVYEAKMNDAKEVKSPVSLNRVPLFTDGTPLDKPSEYRFMVGGL